MSSEKCSGISTFLPHLLENKKTERPSNCASTAAADAHKGKPERRDVDSNEKISQLGEAAQSDHNLDDKHNDPALLFQTNTGLFQLRRIQNGTDEIKSGKLCLIS